MLDLERLDVCRQSTTFRQISGTGTL